jgi:hypothetical protein
VESPKTAEPIVRADWAAEQDWKLHRFEKCRTDRNVRGPWAVADSLFGNARQGNVGHTAGIGDQWHVRDGRGANAW